MEILDDAGSAPSPYSIRAVERVCDILDLAQRSPDGFSLTDVVESTALPKSSAFRYLATLESRRYVERDSAEGHFRIGAAFLPMRSRHLDMLAQRARPLLEALRDQFEETINLAMLDGNRVAYLEILESARSMRLSARKGDRDYLHCTAVGKAVATMLPVERIKASLVAEGMPARTAATITDAGRYLAEVELTRSRGFALDNGENEEDGRCLAVPLDGPVPTALSLSAPSARFQLADVQQVAEALMKVADELAQEQASALPTDHTSAA